MRTANINNKINTNFYKFNQNKGNNKSFKGFVDTAANTFVKMQESTAAARCFQDTATNWLPKAVFTRSAADLAEMTFTEGLESGIFYAAPTLLGEYILRKGIFKNTLPKELRKHVSSTVDEILTNDNLVKSGASKKIIPVKAGILLGCMAIPAMEYALNFAKNLFTLKVFKTSNFDKIANLDKNAVKSSTLSAQEIEHQKKVKSSAIKHIIGAGIASAAAIAGGVLLAKKAPNSANLQKFSEFILEPGKHIAEKLHTKPSTTRFLNEFLNLDLATKGSNKLGLSKGMLATTVSIGILGYLGAAKDRSELDFKEVLTRTPISGAYAIFGSDLLEDNFIKFLAGNKKFTEKFPDLIKKTKEGLYEVPSKFELDKQLKSGIIDKSTHSNKIKGKAIISGIPFAFSIVVMGFVIAGMSRFWTQYRYNKLHKNDGKNQLANEQQPQQQPIDNQKADNEEISNNTTAFGRRRTNLFIKSSSAATKTK